MRRLLLDTNIYGEIIVDDMRAEITEQLACNPKILIYSNEIIKKIINEVNKIRTPQFISYEQLKNSINGWLTL